MVPYVDSDHRAYVITTYLESMRAFWPWSHVSARVLEDKLFRAIRGPDGRSLVAVTAGEDPAMCGWMVTRPQRNEIVAGYTRYPLRRKWGIGSTLAIAGGIDFERPVGVWMWTYATERMFLNHAGYGRLFHKVTPDDPNPAQRSEAQERRQHRQGDRPQRSAP